jgi:hypothetical protein
MTTVHEHAWGLAMESLAIISHLLHFAFAILAVYFCVVLFRRHRAWGWLLVSAVFLQPFVLLVMRAIRGYPLLAYKTAAAGSDGMMQISYRLDFPFLYLITVAGLFMLARDPKGNGEPR